MAQAAEAAASSQLNLPGTRPMSEGESEEQIVDVLKGKAPTPAAPKAPKPEPWMYAKPSYRKARASRQ